MKLSNSTFNYLFKAAIAEAPREIIVGLFETPGVDYVGEYKLTAQVHEELMAIAEKEDPDYESLYAVGKDAEIWLEPATKRLYTGLAGDPAYSNEFDSELEDQYYDVIGDWDIDLRTKEVKFNVRVDT